MIVRIVLVGTKKENDLDKDEFESAIDFEIDLRGRKRRLPKIPHEALVSMLVETLGTDKHVEIFTAEKNDKLPSAVEWVKAEEDLRKAAEAMLAVIKRGV